MRSQAHASTQCKLTPPRFKQVFEVYGQTLSKFLQFSTMGDYSPPPTPTSEARGREKSSKEDKNTTEVRKSGGKKSLASKDSASKGSSNVTLNAATLSSVIAEALKSSFEGLRDSMNAGFYWPGRPDCLAR